VLTNAVQAFQILLQIGAGTGLLFILRWFWWRINAVSEITAMVVSFVVAVYFKVIHPELFPHLVIADGLQIVAGVGITTVAWVTATLLSRPTDTRVLREFCRLTNPGGPGWKRVFAGAAADGKPIAPVHRAQNLPAGIICMLSGSVGVYAALFSTGCFIYGRPVLGAGLAALAAIQVAVILKLWRRTIAE
ncbi:MAG: Na+:solute symporter, partial [Kiritimatiellia bacterium]